MTTPATLLSPAEQHLTTLADKSGDTDLCAAVQTYLLRLTSTQRPDPHSAPQGADLAGGDEDTECLTHCLQELREIEAELGPEALTLAEAHRILSRVPGSMVDDILDDRGDR